MNERLLESSELPGADLISDGLDDLQAAKVTANSCLVAMVWPHLVRAGIEVGDPTGLIPEPERMLYRLLGSDGSDRDPYPRCNSLKRRIVSFARALAVRRCAIAGRVG